MEHPLKTLLYELFVNPVLRLLAWPTQLRTKVPVMGTQEPAPKQDAADDRRTHQ
jgi:hypothetical protein